jgi:hypothetical protein
MKQKKQGRAGYFASIAIYFLIGALSGLTILQFIDAAQLWRTPGKMLAWFLILIGVMYVGMVVEIAVHEAGHLVFGLLTGYRFCSYRIFSLMWIREGERVVFRRFSIAGTGGQCLMAPPEPDEEGRIPFVLYNLGGVILNMVTAVLFLIPALLLSSTSAAAVFFRMLVIVALGFALANGIPMRIGEVDNDGANTRALLREPDAVPVFRVMMLVNEASSRGVRVKDMPEEWFREPDERLFDNSIGVSAEVFRLGRLMDEGQYREAEGQIARFLTRDTATNGIYRNLLTADLITCLLIRGDRESAGTLRTKELKRFLSAMRASPSAVRTEIAMTRLIDGDESGAAAHEQRFEKIAASYPYPAEIEAEREILAAVAAAGEKTPGANQDVEK